MSIIVYVVRKKTDEINWVMNPVLIYPTDWKFQIKRRCLEAGYVSSDVYKLATIKLHGLQYSNGVWMNLEFFKGYLKP
jgi:hypothetical protein